MKLFIIEFFSKSTHWQSDRDQGHFNTFITEQGLKKCKFPGKHVQISCWPQFEDNVPLWCRKRNLFFENVALKSLNYHCVHMDQVGLIQPTTIGSHSTCKHYHNFYCILFYFRCLRSVWQRSMFSSSLLALCLHLTAIDFRTFHTLVLAKTQLEMKNEGGG